MQERTSDKEVKTARILTSQRERSDFQLTQELSAPFLIS